MNILVTGARGLLGSYLVDYLREKGETVFATDIDEINILSYVSVKCYISKEIGVQLDLIINCAAYTDVPQAEKDRKKASFLNIQGVGVLAKICLDYNIHLIHFSTDFVFSGKHRKKYTEKDTPDPINFYGFTKYQGEKSLKKKMLAKKWYTIFRIQWIYWDNPKTFFMKLLDNAKKNKILKVVDDEIGSPCSIKFIADVLYTTIFNLPLKRFRGRTYHLTHDDSCSRYVCAKYFLEKMNIDVKVEPIKNYVDPFVQRPKNSVLSNKFMSESLDLKLGSWKEDLDEFVAHLREKRC